MASVTARLVMALNVTRSTGMSLNFFFLVMTSKRCQEMASPSLSGSVARISLSARPSALSMSRTFWRPLVSMSQLMAKSASGSTEPSLDGRSRTWPKLASTL